MSQHLVELGLEGEFFAAVDGRSLEESEVARVYDVSAAETTEWGALTRGEIGCAMSHRKVWQALVESGEAGWLVLEDDAVLAADVPEWLSKLPSLVRNGDVVPFVQTDRNRYHFRRVKVSPGRELVYANQAFVTATAYYITPLAAMRLLNASMPIWFPIDCWYSSPGFKGVTAIRVVWPAAVHARGEAQAPSTIGRRAAHDEKSKHLNSQGGMARYAVRKVRLWLKNRFFNRPVRFD